MTTNSSVVYAETGIFPLHIINVCMIKYWFKILNGDTNKLIHLAYTDTDTDTDTEKRQRIL